LTKSPDHFAARKPEARPSLALQRPNCPQMTMKNRSLDCVVIGYNELPFEQYEHFLENYGKDTEAYRDLMFSFVDLDGRKMDYVGLMNYVFGNAGNNGNNLSFA
jgi:hypothetical protein